MAKLFDPLAAREAVDGERLKLGQMPKELTRRASKARTGHKTKMLEKKQARGQQLSYTDTIKADFRVFLTLIWRELLKVDPSPIQLDMAWWLQHGPPRSITMAFRGFSKSWITGAYALWRLFVDPNEKILVVSGNLKRAIATTNWCLELILRMDLLKDLRPKPKNRQSGQMFDVGNCVPAQSASFMAMGIGGQLVGFRGTCIIPDDVETQTNSLTVVMREKVVEAVKEFESVLTPGGVIKYLGTPHDADSLYLRLIKVGYVCRIWPALFPTVEQIKGYGVMLAPYITGYIAKHGPSVVGHSTMPNRFPDADLEGRRVSMGNSEFQLQFLLDLKATFTDKYPLKLKDLTIMALDDRKGPEEVTWGSALTNVLRDLPSMGFEGDWFYGPAETGKVFAKWQKVVGFVDPSGRGTDETALSIVALLMGRVFWLHLWATTDGYAPSTMRAIAKACVRFRVQELRIEANFGDGMFVSLLKPWLIAEWELANRGVKKDDYGGTSILETTSGKQGKELRMLSVLEPVTQSHRLVVNQEVIEWDHKSILAMDAEESRHRYSVGYQYSHLTRDRDCLGKDDRLESLAGACAAFALELGVDPLGMAERAKDERDQDEIMALFDEADEAVGYKKGRRDNRVHAAQPTKR